MKRCLLALLLLVCSGPTFSRPLHLSYHQQTNLVVAYNIGRTYGVQDYLPAVVMTESSLCTNLHNKRIDPLGWGCGQVHLQTLRRVSHRQWTVRELMLQPKLNLELSAMILRECFERYGYGTLRGISCYNTGIAGHIHRSYVKKVQMYRTRLSENLRSLGFQLAAPKESPAYPSQHSPSPQLLEMLGTDESSEMFQDPYYTTYLAPQLDEPVKVPDTNPVAQNTRPVDLILGLAVVVLGLVRLNLPGD